MIQNLKQSIINTISDSLMKLGVADPEVLVERAVSADFGEFAVNVAMRYAKQLQQSPLELAEHIVADLQSAHIKGVAEVSVARPGFINIRLSTEVMLSNLQNVLAHPDQCGTNHVLRGQKWVIEHTSPNPNKAMHLGHLRNNLVGMGLIHLLKASGAEVVSDCIYNDRGIAIAKVMYGFLAHMRKSAETPVEVAAFIAKPDGWFTPAEKELRPDSFVERCYVLAEADFQNDQIVEQTVRRLVVDWEAHDESVWQLWRHMLQFAYQGQSQTLARLGSCWDHIWYEHEHYQKGKEYVQQGLQSGVFLKLEDGAVISQLEDAYQLPDTVLLKNDGTSLYITQDLALTDLKKQTYGADRLVWVVGNEQSMAFKQLFACCEQLGIGERSDFTHVSYGYVGLKSAEKGAFKMSSRAGTVVLIDDVLDGVKASITERLTTEEDTVADVEHTAETLALAAVKFAFLKSDRTQDLTFDIEQSVDIQGDSGVYVLYTFVRTQSLLRKAGNTDSLTVDLSAELGQEAELVRSLLYFESVVEKSLKDLSVHHIAQYLLEISSAFNSWYAKEVILDGSDREQYRLAVVQAVGVILTRGLGILGIDTISEI